jgi:hypothetical protein
MTTEATTVSRYAFPSITLRYIRRRCRTLWIIPTILPRRTVETPRGLFTDPLPAVLASNLLLDNVIVSKSTVDLRDEEESQRDQEEPHNLVEKRSPCPDESSITEGLCHGVVTRIFGLADTKYQKLLDHVAVKER